jgi:hypothetical protein
MRRYLVKARGRTGATLLALACISIACSTAGPATRSTPKPATSFVEYSRDAYIRWKTSHQGIDASTNPLVGMWRRVTTCEELVGALNQAGLGQFAFSAVAENGFVPGVSTAGQIADPEHPCEGAVPREHSHFFTTDGQFGSLDWNAEQVDDGTYAVVDDRTFVISKEFPDVTFHFEIRGDTILFDPVIPDCATQGCFEASWAVSVAYPGKTWERVG